MPTTPPRRLRSLVDGWDVLITAAAVALFIGVVLTAHIGLALIVVGTLGLVSGIAGARGTEVGEHADAKRKGS